MLLIKLCPSLKLNLNLRSARDSCRHRMPSSNARKRELPTFWLGLLVLPALGRGKSHPLSLATPVAVYGSLLVLKLNYAHQISQFLNIKYRASKRNISLIDAGKSIISVRQVNDIYPRVSTWSSPPLGIGVSVKP